MATRSDPANWRWSWAARLGLLALVLNGFAILTVNYWIYTARWAFIARNSAHYTKPPTISRAISDPVIGVPFSFWVTISAICLVVGVAVLAVHYVRLLRFLDRPSRYLRLASLVLMPVIMALQAASSVGMHLLSAYRFPDAHEMHMAGSYTFFVSQAVLIVFFTIYNHALLRDRASLDRLVALGVIGRRWVRVRFFAGLGSIALVGVYFALFTAKDAYEYPDAALLYVAYVSTEPMVITSFLLVLGLCHADLYRRRRG